jgi:AGCS family alanine or glycine:cation symporter
MWIAAFFGMMVKYSESVLGVYYRRRNSEGAWSGGPMYYLEDGLGSIKHCKRLGKFLGILFCVFTVLASFGIGNMGQINKITINFGETFLSGVNKGMFMGAPNVNWLIGFILMLAAAFIIMGGFRRLAAVSEKLIPFMSVAYIIGCLIVIILHVTKIPAVFASIFRFALGPKALAGGAAGTAVQLAFNTIKNGCKRGVFSNEAGLGSSVMVHSNTCAREPVRQGLWGIAEVFLDTMVICTMTAIVVLSSGAIDLDTGIVLEGTNDATLVAKAFGATLGRPGEWFVVLAITLFAFTTVLGWSYYGAKVTEYLFGIIWAKIYRVVFILLIILGAVMESNLAWDISDTFNGLMMIPNLIGLLAQIPLIIKLTHNYADRKIRGRDMEPMLSYDPDIQAEACRAVLNGLD